VSLRAIEAATEAPDDLGALAELQAVGLRPAHMIGMVAIGCLYVSTGAEAQGRPGGGPVTPIYEVIG
jgi:hypothetical protein